MKTWFITEASQGLGHECALAALERGDLVAASAADATALNQLSGQHGTALLPVEMDVTDRRSVFDAIAAAHGHFGRLDIIANTAEYRQLGCVEEVTEKQVRDQMEINFLGALPLTASAVSRSSTATQARRQPASAFSGACGPGQAIVIAVASHASAENNLYRWNASSWLGTSVTPPARRPSR
jgi:NAD(P)-dependent dehydrogenase (short-subunit alcohol dehydrogenase family)